MASFVLEFMVRLGGVESDGLLAQKYPGTVSFS
jgi:hypothetical protein